MHAPAPPGEELAKLLSRQADELKRLSYRLGEQGRELEELRARVSELEEA